MDNRSNKPQKLARIDARLGATLEDDFDILVKLRSLGADKSPIIEIKTELPARPDIDILLGLVMRWTELSKALKKPIRVYAWCYNNQVEKVMQRLLCDNNNVLITILPGELREVKRYE